MKVAVNIPMAAAVFQESLTVCLIGISRDGREERVTRNREMMAFRHGVLGEKEGGRGS
jgi:hypothetical protein